MNHDFPRLILALGIALATASSQAMPPDGPCAHPPGPMTQEGMAPDPAPPWLRGINLSEAMRDRIFDIMHAQLPNLRARAREAQQSREALHRLSFSGSYDDAKAKLLSDTLARATAEMALVQSRADQQIYRLLTPEQRQELDSRNTRDPREPGKREARR
jgi:periplasmic protein CpxP/Spy